MNLLSFTCLGKGYAAFAKPLLRESDLQDNEFINFVNKHDFSMIGFGFLCGMLRDSLEELTVMRCNDFFDLSAWGPYAIQSLKSLKSLRLEEVKCSGENVNLISRLSNLSQVFHLVLHRILARLLFQAIRYLTCEPPLAETRRNSACCEFNLT